MYVDEGNPYSFTEFHFKQEWVKKSVWVNFPIAEAEEILWALFSASLSHCVYDELTLVVLNLF